MRFAKLAPYLSYAGVCSSFVISVFFPHALYAATFASLVNSFLGVLGLIIPLIFALTFLVIVWGVVQAWILNAGNAEKVSEGQMIALWGIIGLVVMAGMWGLIALVRTSLFSF